MFHVDLVHGWVVDPQESETWDVVIGKCGSYNRAVECVVRGDDLGKGFVVESSDKGGSHSGHLVNLEGSDKVRDGRFRF